MRLYVIRHGKTVHNADRRIQGQLLDDGLSEEGRAQAAALARRFEAVPLAAICASTMKRARETAEPLAAACGAKLSSDAGLREFSWGEYEGKIETPEIEAVIKSYFAQVCSGELDIAPPGGESARAAAARAVDAALRFAEANRERSAAIVAHGRINKILISTLLHGTPARMEEYPQSNTGVTLLEGGPGSWRIVYVDDRRHLMTSVHDDVGK